LTLKDMLEAAAQRYGDKVAIICGERRLSYTEFNSAANKMASALKKLGVNRGQRVAMLLSSSPEFAVIYFGIVKIGAIAVPLDTKYKAGELSCLFDDNRPSVLVSEKPYLDTVAPLLDRLSYIKNVIDVTPGAGRFLNYEQIIAAESGRAVAGGAVPDDVAHIAYTSGPTLRPHGVMLLHGNLAKAAAISAGGFKQTDKDIVTLFALPMHHAVGLVVIMLTSLYAGSTVIMLTGLSIHGLLETIEREKATIFMGVPFVHALLLREVAAGGIRHDIGSLRLCASAGAPLPLEIIDRYRELLGRELIQFYGLTEATCHVTCQPVDGGGKDGYVGPALPGFQIKVVDDAGGELGPNQPGEIIISGPIMSGYYNNPRATDEAIRDGWLYTGDIGSIDEEGDIVILGLKKPMLIVKGQNIYHSDVEDVIATHPKVAEVTVVGIADPDGMRGEVVRAVIQLKPGQAAREAEIKRYCLAHLANYKVPKQVIFVANLPRMPGGQVNKEALKDLLPGVSSGSRVNTKIN